MTTIWQNGLEVADKFIIFCALMHTVHETDAITTKADHELAERHINAMLSHFDTGSSIGIVNNLTGPAIATVCASMVAAFRDNHAMQFNMTEPQWKLAEEIMAELNEDHDIARYFDERRQKRATALEDLAAQDTEVLGIAG